MTLPSALQTEMIALKAEIEGRTTGARGHLENIRSWTKQTPEILQALAQARAAMAMLPVAPNQMGAKAEAIAAIQALEAALYSAEPSDRARILRIW